MFNWKGRGLGLLKPGICLGLVLAAGAVQGAPPGSPPPAPAAVAVLQPPPPEWVRSELIFNLQGKDGAEVTQGEWELFLSEVVTPRFSDGLTILEGFGKPKGREGSFAREPINVLVLVHPDTEKFAESLRAVAAQYKKRFHLSVIRIKTPAEVKFY